VGSKTRAGDVPAGQGAAEADRLGRVPKHTVQLQHGARRHRAFCFDAGASKRGQHRRRSATARPGVRDRSGRARRGRQPIPDRGYRGTGRRCAYSQSSPARPFRESVRLAEQNLYSRARDLVGDRNPREHEFVVQLRSFDSGKSGANLGVAVLIALCSALLGRSLKGGLAIVGGLNLGGSVELVHNPIEVMELAMEKGAGMVLLPVSCRRALLDLSDDVATRVQAFFYLDATDALRKPLNDG
jgi:predicted ATP-dependent Lon-type protease